MKFSIAPCMQKVVDGKRVMDLEGYIAEAQLAEKRGWFAAYTGEKHFGDTSYSSNPTMACLYGLSQTTTLKFCTGVTVLPLHHPVSVAEDAALVDTMYPNRFRMTTGAGYFAGDYAPFGVSLDERHERMEKGMDVIAAYRRSDCIDVPAPWSGRVPPRDEALGEDTLEVYMGAWSLHGADHGRVAHGSDSQWALDQTPRRRVPAGVRQAREKTAHCAVQGSLDRCQ